MTPSSDRTVTAGHRTTTMEALGTTVRRRHPDPAARRKRVKLDQQPGPPRHAASPTEREHHMGLAILLLVLALIFGGIGIFVEALQWVLIIALVLLVLGAVTGARGRGSRV
jgi:hypothetical protein